MNGGRSGGFCFGMEAWMAHGGGEGMALPLAVTAVRTEPWRC